MLFVYFFFVSSDNSPSNYLRQFSQITPWKKEYGILCLIFGYKGKQIVIEKRNFIIIVISSLI